MEGNEEQIKKSSILSQASNENGKKELISEKTCMEKFLVKFFVSKTDLLSQTTHFKLYLINEILPKTNYSKTFKFLSVIVFYYMSAKGNLKSSTFRNLIINVLKTGKVNLKDQTFDIFEPLADDTEIDNATLTVSDDKKQSLDEIQKYLSHGNKEKALLLACKSQRWPLCFLIAQSISTRALKAVSKTYLNQSKCYSSDLVSLLRLSLDLEVDFTANLSKTWRKKIISLLSVQTKHSLTLLKRLGDKILSNLDDIYLAQCCYLLSSLPLSFSLSSRVLLLSLNHKKLSFFHRYSILSSSEVTTEALLSSVILTEAVVKVMTYRQEKKAVSQPGSVAGTNYGLEDSMFSIKTTATTVRKYDRARCILLFTPFKLSVVKFLVDKKLLTESKVVLETVCQVCVNSSLKMKLSSKEEIFLKEKVAEILKNEDELKDISLVKDMINGKKDKSLSFLSQPQSIDQIDLLSNSQSRFPVPVPEVQSKPQVNSEELNSLHQENEAFEAVKAKSGAGWTDPFAKPKPRAKRAVRKNSKPVMIQPQTNNLFKAEISEEFSAQPIKRETSFADAEDVMPSEIRQKSDSITDPFAISQRRNSYNSDASSRGMLPAQNSLQRRISGSSIDQPFHQNSYQPNHYQHQQQQQPVVNQIPLPAQEKHDPKNGGGQPKPQNKVKNDGFLGRMKSRLIRALVPVGDNATAVDKGLGSQLDGYYDETLKRWVFPSDDTSKQAAHTLQGPPPTLMPIPVNGNFNGSHGNNKLQMNKGNIDPAAAAGKNTFRNSRRRKYVKASFPTQT